MTEMDAISSEVVGLTDTIMKYVFSYRFWIGLVLIFGGLFLYKKIGQIAKKQRENNDSKQGVALFLKISKVFVAVLAIVLVLQINGINVTALISGLGIIGIIVGFALQDELKDWIMGANIVREHFFKVGDTVKYGEVEGVVTGFDLKCTTIKSVLNGDVLHVSNRNISEITIVSDWCDLDIPAPYSEPAERMREVCREIKQAFENIENVTSCDFLGTQAFEDSRIDYRLRIHCVESAKPVVRRTALGIVQDVYARENIAIPFSQMDVHVSGIETSK